PGCVDDAAESLVHVGDAGLALDAAAQGLGRATVPELLAAADLASGRVVALGEARPYRLGYWLVAPLPQWRQKKVKTLVEAL
ncbi:LysR substrate-binding domain-containing protein, partial [Shewanella algae]